MEKFLEMCEPIGMIYSTKKYDLFNNLDFNRDVTENRYKKLAASFSEKEILNPIVVNENLEIIDGQGRFEVLRTMERPIKFIIAEGADIKDCRRMNLYNTNWKKDDFVGSYARAGNVNYINLKDVRTKTRFPYNTIMRLVNKGTNGLKKHDVLETGKLVFTFKDAETVMRIAKSVEEIKRALAFTKSLNDVFIVAVKIITEFPQYDHQRMLKKCVSQRHSFGQMSNLESMLQEFTRIYNYKQLKADGKLYFEEYMRNKGYNVRDYDSCVPPSVDNSRSVKTTKNIKNE